VSSGRTVYGSRSWSLGFAAFLVQAQSCTVQSSLRRLRISGLWLGSSGFRPLRLQVHSDNAFKTEAVGSLRSEP